VPVICVGNFVVGGAGKTPTAMALARIARGRGLRPGFLTRGYGGSETGPIVVDTSPEAAARFGDEAPLLAAVAPTVLSHDRAAGAERLVAERVDLIIMDDGLQNPGLAKDFVFAAVDAGAGIGNGLIMPAGPLRAPLSLQLRRSDALVVIGEGDAAGPLIRAAARAGRQTLRARLKPVRVKEWRKEPILAFAGIGRPQKFFETLAEIRAPVEKTFAFPDHHRYSDTDIEQLLDAATAGKLRLVTTEKDLLRLRALPGAAQRLVEKTEAFPVVLEFENPTAVGELIGDTLRRAAAR
jgi:tetraacyldisaccharide 4'-kinase